MGFKKVYLSLLEIFPQIDARALRAVALEHSKDADAAVGSVLEEIVPFFIERSIPSSPLTRSISVSESSDGLVDSIIQTQSEHHQSVNTEGPAQVQNVRNVDSGKQQLASGADDGPSEPFYDTHDGQHGENISELTSSGKIHENRMKMNADMYSHGEPVILTDKSMVVTLQIELSEDPQKEETFSGDKQPEGGIKISSDSIPEHTVGMSQDVETDASLQMHLIQEKEDIAGDLETDYGTVRGEENDLGKSSSDGNNPVDGTASSTVHDVNVRPKSNVQLVEATDMHESNLDKSKACSSTDTASSVESLSTIIGAEDQSTLNSTMSESSQIHTIDVIEDIIADARNNKKILFSEIESFISLMRKVELQEQAAEQGKVEAAIGGVDILNKVEELKQMLQRAKEANDMHAGEVYGEKAVLATELRELQSRVLSLSDERDKALAFLDEMRQTLEGRLAAAEDKIRSAEQERVEKEIAARQSFADQEIIMEKMVQESKILRQQAEDNAKLQEFLVDRGHVVDTLQGEIAVLCQDVRLLKEKFDQHLPLSKSLFSSQTSFILASSSSSLKSLVPDQVEAIPVGDDNSLETQMNRDHEQFPEEEATIDDPETQKNSDHKQVPEEEATSDGWEARSDEGWEILDNPDEIHL